MCVVRVCVFVLCPSVCVRPLSFCVCCVFLFFCDHLFVGYRGRASSIVLPGTEIRERIADIQWLQHRYESVKTLINRVRSVKAFQK
jgi:hypothetical protein